jgi:hypothetical protein
VTKDRTRQRLTPIQVGPIFSVSLEGKKKFTHGILTEGDSLVSAVDLLIEGIWFCVKSKCCLQCRKRLI